MGFPRLLLRWIATACFTALQIATVKIYQAKGNFTSAQKSAFNAIMLALALLLSLNFLESFKELAKALRPTLKKRTREQTLRQSVDNLESLLSVWKLLREVWDEPAYRWLAAFSVFWLSLNVAAQVAVTVTNLTYTVNDGVNYNDTYINPGSPGTVHVPDLSCYYKDPSHKECQDYVSISTIAHSFGEMILMFNGTPYSELDDILRSKDMVPYFHRTEPGQQQIAYRFNEYNPNDTQGVYPHLTNRTIYAEANNCITYDNISTDSNDPQTLTYPDGTIEIPQDFLGREGTTYIYRGFHIPVEADWQSCGERCLWMWVYKNPSGFPKDSPEPMALYKCPVNISHVNNASRPEHNITNDVAKTAAAAIALRGIYRGPPSNGSEQDYASYQFYATGSPWEIHNHTADYVGDRLALFALGSIISMARLNPLIPIPGEVPHLGHSVVTYKPWFTIIWVCIVGAHLAVTAATVLLDPVKAKQEEPEHEMDRTKGAEEVNESREGLV